MTTTSDTLPHAAPETGTTSEVLRDSLQQSAVTIATCSHAMTNLAATSEADKLKDDAIRGQKSLSSIAQQMTGAGQQWEQAQSTISTLHAAIQAIETAATAIGRIGWQRHPCRGDI